MFDNQQKLKGKEKEVYIGIYDKLTCDANTIFKNTIQSAVKEDKLSVEEAKEKTVEEYNGRHHVKEIIGNYELRLRYGYQKNKQNSWGPVFDYFISYTNQKQMSIESVGWKIHVSISQKNKKSFDASMEGVIKILMDAHVCSFKVISDCSRVLQDDTQTSKQITIYFETDTKKDWSSIVNRIEQTLADKKIKIDTYNKIDKIVTEHVTLRNELLPEKERKTVVNEYKEFYVKYDLPKNYLPAFIALEIAEQKKSEPYNVFNLPEPQFLKQLKHNKKELSEKTNKIDFKL